MKEIIYVEFGSGWRPPVYRNIDITRVQRLRNAVSKNGNEYLLLVGHISDEDATYLKIADPKARIREISQKR